MKHMKTASAIAVSMIAAGAAAAAATPAAASTVTNPPPMSLNGGVATVAEALTSQQVQGAILDPVVDGAQGAKHTLDAAQEGKPQELLEGATETTKPLMGGLPVGG